LFVGGLVLLDRQFEERRMRVYEKIVRNAKEIDAQKHEGQ